MRSWRPSKYFGDEVLTLYIEILDFRWWRQISPRVTKETLITSDGGQFQFREHETVTKSFPQFRRLYINYCMHFAMKGMSSIIKVKTRQQKIKPATDLPFVKRLSAWRAVLMRGLCFHFRTEAKMVEPCLGSSFFMRWLPVCQMLSTPLRIFIGRWRSRDCCFVEFWRRISIETLSSLINIQT